MRRSGGRRGSARPRLPASLRAPSPMEPPEPGISPSRRRTDGERDSAAAGEPSPSSSRAARQGRAPSPGREAESGATPDSAGPCAMGAQPSGAEPGSEASVAPGAASVAKRAGRGSNTTRIAEPTPGAVLSDNNGALAWPGPLPRADDLWPAALVLQGFHCVAIIIFLLGLGTLLPWNFFITAIPYFQSRLVAANCSAGKEDGNRTALGLEPASPCSDDFGFSNWLALLSQLPLLLFTLLNSLLYQCIPDKVRVLGSLFGILLLFSLTAGLVRVEMPPHSFFSITMASVWFINSFCAVLQGSLFGQLGSFPQSYNTVFLSGQGMAGTFAAIAMLLSMAKWGVNAQCDPNSSPPPLQEFARHYLEKRPPEGEEPGCELECKSGLLPPEEGNGGMPNGIPGRRVDMGNGEILTAKQIEVKCPPGVMNGAGRAPPKPSLLAVLQKIWRLALCIVMVFSVTLSVFPAITASVTSVSENATWRAFFSPVCCFLLFNLMDWLGRSATSYLSWPDKRLGLLPAVVALRLLIIPPLLLCNITQRSFLPVLFVHDAWFIVFMVALSLSNGYFVSLTMCLAPKQVQPQESELAGAIMTFFLALGLSCGAGLSFVLKALL
ncbi:hypothetical protein lerEdw1_007379 [Lerista edwardsae]|nr:hypothetical protein lerEdw1_007379 [Lerista edwardsae]